MLADHDKFDKASAVTFADFGGAVVSVNKGTRNESTDQEF